MSLLSGKSILAAMNAKSVDERIVITPFFSPGLQIREGAASIDLRLGCRFSVARKHRLEDARPIDEAASHPRRWVTEYYVAFGNNFVLHPRQFVLGTTLEWLHLPAKYGGYILGRSSYGRRGLIIATATGVHPSYSGVLTLELTNVAEIPLVIRPGQPICQLFIHEVLGAVHDKPDVSAFLASFKGLPGEIKSDEITDFLKGLGE